MDTPGEYIIISEYTSHEIRVINSILIAKPREIDFTKSTLKMYYEKTISMGECVEVAADN